MIPASLRTPPKMRRVMTVGAIGAAMGLSLLLSACGTTTTPNELAAIMQTVRHPLPSQAGTW